jgi:Kef-type K+ transport system membrane component KefB
LIPLPLAAVEIDTGSFFTIVVVAAVSAITVAVVPKRFAPPVVVVELMLGIVVGPELLGLAHSDEFIEFFSNLGLGMLFFFAGYEIDFKRIRGRPMKLGAAGWLLSVVLAYGIGGALAAAGVVVSFLYTGSAMATTAIGTLIPILKDNGELKTKFGTYLLAAGGAGEFGPILLVTLVLSTASPLHESVILLGFIALALFLALLSVRYAWRGWPALERTFESSSQLAVRVTVVLVFGLVLLANKLGLDLLLGGFVAGMITRVALQGHELQVFESKLTAVGFGFFVPFFFVTSGIEFDLAALGSRPRRPRLLLGDRAAPRRRDHHDRDRDRPHENLDRGRPGRRRDALDPGLPLRRPGAAQGQRGRGRGQPAGRGPLPTRGGARRPAGTGWLAPPDQLQALVDGRLGTAGMHRLAEEQAVALRELFEGLRLHLEDKRLRLALGDLAGALGGGRLALGQQALQ